MDSTTARAHRSLSLDVALVPAYLPATAAGRAGTVFVVIDVVRATTTLCVLLERGCRRVLIAPSIEAARETSAGSAGYLLAGEIEGLAPSGFDFGNSPRELAAADIAGQELIFATTNGTRALRACLGGRAIFAGAFRNAGAVTASALAAASVIAGNQRTPAEPRGDIRTAGARGERASEADLGQTPPDIVFVCSGRGNRPAYDDTLCAGYLVDRLIAHASATHAAITLREGARIARSCAAAALASGTIRDALAVSDAGRAVKRVGLADDLIWCADVDAAAVVPVVTGERPADSMLVMEAAENGDGG